MSCCASCPPGRSCTLGAMRYSMPFRRRAGGTPDDGYSRWAMLGAVGRRRRRWGPGNFGPLTFGQMGYTDPNLVLPPGEGEDEDDPFPTGGTGERVPEDDELPPDFIAPGAVLPVADAWDLENCTYTIQPGDTFVGLAKTYLGNGERWRELWNPNKGIIPNPDSITTAGPIVMTEEACNNMRAYVKKGRPPGVLPGKIPPGEVAKLTESKTKYYVAGAVGVAALVGLYIATQS